MRLSQPDHRSCGAASLVMARRSVDPEYAAQVRDQAAFAREASRLHRQITSVVDTAGGLQLPWLRAIGTPPWAVSRELRLITGADYEVHPVLARDPWRWIQRAREARPVAVFVGNRVSPRHVVLVLSVADDAERPAAWTYEPASGRVLLVRRRRWEEGPLELAGWNRPWFVIAPEADPEGPHSPA